MPISTKLAGFIKRYIATGRPPEVDHVQILVSRTHRPFTTEGIKSLTSICAETVAYVYRKA